MFNASRYQQMYRKFLGPLSQEVQVAINTGVAFVPQPVSKAHVSRLKETDLITDGSLRLGDMRVIMLTEDMPVGVTHLSLDDRLIIDGRFYSIIQFDPYTRKVGETEIAIDMIVRGGGIYEAPVTYNLIAENGDNLIAENGDNLVSG
jgi:hypothetical protein